MNMIEEWISPEVLKNKAKFAKDFNTNKPFQHISIPNFFTNEKAEDTLLNIRNQEYYKEEHDLYSFMRTIDFRNSNNLFIKKLRATLLSTEFVKLIEEISSVKIKKDVIELHSLKLQNTDYLLCHDDQVEGRKIAFIINLSKGWKKEFGGSLELYDSANDEATKLSKSIVPAFNQFNMFLVSSKSFHAVHEVMVDKERESISGWFYED